jgi:transcriptional regulator with XRE-family HTH domain
VTAKQELREFLRARRARLSPADVGFEPSLAPRRVPGLRREELAHLAGVSADYYTRIEQGRAINVSDDVLRAVADALRLKDDERAHLFNLAHSTNARRAPAARTPPRVRAGVLRILDALPTPAFVLGYRLEFLATNRMARALLCDFDARPERERNHARWVFLDPAARERYLDWDEIARDNVAALRMYSGRYADDPELSDLIAELSAESPEFSSWWSDHEVSRHSHGTKRYNHPTVGELTIAYEALPVPDATDQVLYIYTAEPGTASERALQQLTT